MLLGGPVLGLSDGLAVAAVGITDVVDSVGIFGQVRIRLLVTMF